ncbi:MAG: replication-relaxation family protein, partial [Acidobacteriales bacterium]|nr:replication-relaxation family protein [Terriglobales bacterium]
TTLDKVLFRELAMLRVVDREQASLITGRRNVSVSTCNAWLLKLCRVGLLKRFFIATELGGLKALYSLTAKSAALVSSPLRPLQRSNDSVMISDPFVQHQLAVNAVILQLKCSESPIPDVRFRRWMSFPQSISPAVPLTPDAYIEFAFKETLHPVFCEVDRGTETQTVWKKKIALYIRLAIGGDFPRVFGQERFRVIVVAESERRLAQIRKTVASQTEKIFWFSTLKNINQKGFFASHWLRPAAEASQAFL